MRPLFEPHELVPPAAPRAPSTASNPRQRRPSSSFSAPAEGGGPSPGSAGAGSSAGAGAGGLGRLGAGGGGGADGSEPSGPVHVKASLRACKVPSP